MPLPTFRYPLDPTGLDVNNLVDGEIHSLNNKEVRALVPVYGPIFREGLTVHDDNNNNLLTYQDDYVVVELLQEATAKFGKEIVAAILIINPLVSNAVRIRYQVLGGLYQNDASAVINIYETFLADNRAVDWSNILNKPLQFPPTLHNHLLEDIYGFEPVVVALERIRNAIVLSDVPAFERLISWVKDTVQIASVQDIIDGNSNAKLINMELLLLSLEQFNFNSITITPSLSSVNEGQTINYELATTNLPENTKLYWTIEHNGTDASDFNVTSGIINISANKGQFTVSVADNSGVSEFEESFKVVIRKNAIDGFILARTGTMILGAHGGVNFVDLKVACCLFNPAIQIMPESMYLTREY